MCIAFSRGGTGQSVDRRSGFTLIELLVVVAIIALLISILLPSLSAARDQAKATKCAANLSSVGKALHSYLAESKGVFPLSYAYATDASGKVDLDNQSLSIAFGYVHWSYALFNRGEADPAAFQCPSMPNRGHPRTNPGPDPENWEEDQRDHHGNTKPSSWRNGLVEDRQSPRIAYAGNAAIIPRNKLGNVPSGGVRQNKFARESEIESAGRTIVASELNRNWRVLADGSDGALLGKAHRPLNPFYNENSGYDEYNLPPNLGLYRYWPSASDKNYGLIPLAQVEEATGQAPSSQFSEMNYIGRHHPGGDHLGGTANFLYVDGHAARKPILQTLVDREWGKRYYAITGNNELYTAGYEFMP